MCLTFEVTIAYGFLDIETNVAMFTEIRTDERTDKLVNIINTKPPLHHSIRKQIKQLISGSKGIE